jgi:hypothetical protein
MIEITDMHTPITPQQGLSMLQAATDKCGCFIDLDCVLAHESYHLTQAHSLLKVWREEANSPYLLPTARTDIIQVLTDRFNIHSYKLTGKQTASLSIADDILQALETDEDISEDARLFVTHTRELTNHLTISRSLQQFKELPLSMSESFEGHRMVIAKPLWSLLNTSRYSTSNPNLQGVNAACKDIYTAPKGFSIIFSDSGQIEPRITYSYYIRDELLRQLIILYDDAYFGQLHFIKLSEQDEVEHRKGKPLTPFPITDEMKEDRQKLKKLGLAGNYGSQNLSTIDPVLGPLYTRKIVKHPLRIQWEDEVKLQVASGNEEFTTAFGNKISPKETQKHSRNSSGWLSHVTRCGINNPIQGTAADLMLFSLYSSLPLLEKFGGFLSYYKHDEGCFCVPEAKVDEVAPMLQSCLGYQVSGWIPIRADLHIGRKVVDNDNGVL